MSRAIPHNHEGIPSAMIEEFRGEVDRLIREGQNKFGTGLGPWRNGELTFVDQTDAVFADKVRYAKLGKIVELVPWTDDLSEESLEQEPINTCVYTPLPITPKWPNVYIFENFIHGEENAVSGLTYSLHCKEYTPKGIPIQDRASDAVMSEHLPAPYQQITDWNSVQNLIVSGLQNVSKQRLQSLRDDFPTEMQHFSGICTEEHFKSTLDLLKLIGNADEIGCDINPFARA